MGYNESYIENMDSREGFSADEIEVYEAMADGQEEGYPCETCGGLCDGDFCSPGCAAAAEMEECLCEDDGQPSEYTEWQDLYGGDDAYDYGDCGMDG